MALPTYYPVQAPVPTKKLLLGLVVNLEPSVAAMAYIFLRSRGSQLFDALWALACWAWESVTGIPTLRGIVENTTIRKIHVQTQRNLCTQQPPRRLRR